MENEFCKLCRNRNDTSTDVCAECRGLVEGWLAEAYRRWIEQADRAGRPCCGRMSSDKTHIYFHGKGWECETDAVGVEMGVSFYHDQARTYYIRDFDSYCDSEEYGKPISYLDPEFWEKLDAQLDRAAEAADATDLESCDECGYHFIGEPHDHKGDDATDGA